MRIKVCQTCKTTFCIKDITEFNQLASRQEIIAYLQKKGDSMPDITACNFCGEKVGKTYVRKREE